MWYDSRAQLFFFFLSDEILIFLRHHHFSLNHYPYAILQLLCFDLCFPLSLSLSYSFSLLNSILLIIYANVVMITKRPPSELLLPEFSFLLFFFSFLFPSVCFVHFAFFQFSRHEQTILPLRARYLESKAQGSATSPNGQDTVGVGVETGQFGGSLFPNCKGENEK